MNSAAQAVVATLLEDGPEDDLKGELLATADVLAANSKRMDDAAVEYTRRAARKAHPKGHFMRNGTWWPSPEEERDCCRTIRRPSKSFPYSLMLHCRTVQHVANLFNVDASELRRRVR